MDHKKKVIILTLMIVMLILVISLTSWYVQIIIESNMVCSCAIPLPILIPIIAAIGLIFGVMIYYIFFPEAKEKCIDVSLLQKFFDETELKIVSYIIKKGGEISQANIVSNTNIPKVKVFRALEKLRSRGIINKESMGKTNKIILSRDIYDIVSK